MKKNILFLGFFISKNEMKDILKKDIFPSVQTFNFSTKLVKSLSIRYNIDALSFKAVSDFPHCKKVLFLGKKYNTNLGYGEVIVTELPFINWGLFKVLSRFIFSFIAILKKFITFRRNKKVDYLFVYSVHIPYMLLAVIFSRLFKVELIGVWTDPPALKTESDSFTKRNLRNIELVVSKFLMSKYKKLIVLSKHLVNDFAPESKYLVIESIYDELLNTASPSLVSDQNQRINQRIAYFGSVNARYGIKNLVSSFESIKTEAVELHIYGSGDFSEQLREISLMNEKIIYHGFINPDQVSYEIIKNDFLINLRSPKEEFVKYSFPSKITEYMSSGIPFITTFLPGMPTEYKKHLLVLENDDPIVVGERLREIIKLSPKERKQIASGAQTFIRSKDTISISNEIYNFLTISH